VRYDGSGDWPDRGATEEHERMNLNIELEQEDDGRWLAEVLERLA